MLYVVCVCVRECYKFFIKLYLIIIIIMVSKETVFECLNKIIARVVPREIIIFKSPRSIIKRHHLYKINVPSNYLYTYYSNRK